MSKPGVRRPFDSDRLRRLLPAGRELADAIHIVDSCSSTSDLAREWLATGSAKNGLLLLAETQTDGRGRSQRDWWSGPPTSNLCCTLALSLPEPPLAAGLAAACAVAAACERFAKTNAALKWPNDILLLDPTKAPAKVAGILAESLAVAPSTLLLGMGINVASAPPNCARIGANIPREPLLAAVLLGLDRRLRHLVGAGPDALEQECLARLRLWAPWGIQVAGDSELGTGPLLEFSLSEGLTWGKAPHTERRPLGLLRELLPLPHP